MSAAIFLRSTFCHDGSCVEVADRGDGSIAVRDAKDVQQPELRYTSEEWAAFIRGVKAGEFDFGLLADRDPNPAA